MSSDVKKTDDGRFRIRLGEDAEAELSAAEIKTLLIQILGQMAPGGDGGGAAADPVKTLDRLMGHLQDANDVGIETLIRAAADDDVLVLLKSAEENEALSAKLYRNMSQRTAKMYRDDLSFRYADGIPDADIGRAASRLAAHAQALESEGLLQYGG